MAKKSCDVKENVGYFYGVQAGRQNGLFAAAFVARGWLVRARWLLDVGCGEISRRQLVVRSTTLNGAGWFASRSSNETGGLAPRSVLVVFAPAWPAPARL